MPPKKGKKKAADDDWEAEAFGETPDPIAAAEQDAKAAEDAKATAEEEAFAGGLMGALQRRGKKAKKNKQNNDFVEGEEPAAQNGEDKPEAKGAEEATAEDADDFWAAAEQDNKAKKNKQDNKAASSPAGGDDEEEGGRVKSKKEKEREKKEREKQRKKEQAAKKKATAPAKKEEPAKPAPEAKKAEPTPAPAPVPEPAAASAAAGGKKKKLPAHLAALQKQQEELRKQREEEARLLAEEKARLEEEERKAAEEAKRKEEQKALKKQKEKERIAQLKKEGKYLTKAQKEAQARNELRMKQMLEAGGAKVAGLEEPADKPKKPVYERRKKGKKGPEEPKKEESPVEEVTEKVAELKVEEPPKPAEPEPEKKEEDDELDDWEAMADKEDGVPTADGVKDSWDAPTDEEDNAPAAKPAAANGKPAAASAKKAESSESESESDSDESSSEDEAVTAKQRADAARKAAAAERRAKQHEQALAARSKDDLRSPICCILGHVDTGKTKLLDKIRQTNVQEGEAGGITQQIGATYFPVEALKKKTAVVNQNNEFEFRVPGLLVIDTPGHESFTNLRSRGSSLCNMAILVIDIVHGLEPQTIESLNLLKAKKTPFIVALNKIDRLYGWRKIENNGVQDSLAFQSKAVLQEFKNRVDFVKVQLSEQGLNSELYYDNKNLARNVSLVPTSAITGEGVPDLLKLLVSLTQDRLTSSLMYLSEVEATVLEVKVVEGLGTTIDVILSNGILREGDRIVLCGNPEPIATNIRALLTPAEMKELRIKSQYVHNKEIKAAMGVKIAADGLDSAIAGSRLLVVGKDDDEEELMDDVMEDLQRLMGNISVNKVGVSVQASTLGSLEALLEFLRSEKIPVASVGIGPVFRRDIMPATIMLEKAKQYAMLLAFDVKVDKAAQEYADEMGVTIFTADIIYHLFDAFKVHQEKYKEQLKEEAKMNAVFPCELKTVAVFNKKDPIVVGVDVVRGTLKKLTPICTVKVDPTTKQRQVIRLGRVTSIERDHKEVPNCKAGQPSVAVKIEGPNQPLYGRQLEEDDPLYSEISRLSIDTLKEFYRDEVKNEEWKHIVDLKKLFDIS